MSDLNKLVGASGPYPNQRAKDAAAIILFDRSGQELKVLVGQRSKKHVFMPDAFVFPGGRRDPTDHRLSFANDLRDDTHIELAKTLRRRSSLELPKSASRALALAAMRELQEETGIAAWRGANMAQGPDLSPLRFVARAITPPGHIRRFDTRFFAAFTDEINVDCSETRETSELQNIHWLSVEHKSSVNMPAITQLVLDDAIAAMTKTKQSAMQAPVVQYVVRHKRFHRVYL